MGIIIIIIVWHHVVCMQRPVDGSLARERQVVRCPSWSKVTKIVFIFYSLFENFKIYIIIVRTLQNIYYNSSDSAEYNIYILPKTDRVEE